MYSGSEKMNQRMMEVKDQNGNVIGIVDLDPFGIAYQSIYLSGYEVGSNVYKGAASVDDAIQKIVDSIPKS